MPCPDSTDGNYDHLARASTKPVDASLPITSHLLRPAWLQAKTSSIHSYTHLPCQPDVLCMYEHLPPESKIPTHSTHSIFATLRDNGPFEMMTTMPRRQNDVMCTMGLHSVEWNYDYACMGLDLKDIPPGISIGSFGTTVASILC